MPDIIRKCIITGKDFILTQWEQDFLAKMNLPLPNKCIEERHRNRLSYRNERKIYKAKCDLTGKSMISLYSEDKPYKVFSQEAWWSDDWNSLDYGRDFDFNRPFFEQFQELKLEVPRISLLNTNADNSRYCNLTTDNRNCYLVFGGDFNEDCIYSVFCFHSKDSSDLYYVQNSELCYELVDCENCYNVKYSQNTYNSRDSAFLFECRGCHDCFGCINLANKEYYIFNKKYSKEEYEQKIKEFCLDSYAAVLKMAKQFAEFKLNFPHRYARIINCENVSGENILNAKNCFNSFDVVGPAEDVKDILLGGWGLNDSLSCDHVGHKAELFYECLGSIDGSKCALSSFVWSSNDILYCDFVINCQNLFGCTNMQRAEYCVLNKQYSKEEYFELRDRIIEHMKKTGEWGEFFPMKYSPFAYNETMANDYFPLSKNEVLEQGLNWFDEEEKEIGSGPEIPDSIHDVNESILEKTFICKKTGIPYKITPIELKLYKKLAVPIPHFAPDTRNGIRFDSRTPRHLWGRKCDKCSVDIQTSYSPDRPETVYCEKCYLETVL